MERVYGGISAVRELLEEIESYWSTRTEGYWEVNQKELAGSQRKAWLSVLEAELSGADKEGLRILDVGTGPGFFPIILGEAGYCVDAVDYTQGMLELAERNVRQFLGRRAKNVHFCRMDAQRLDFPQGTFDLVISRNLTWNLPDPRSAYGEWMRVLKPGGRLLNFDANWYGYLYDEEKKRDYERDRRDVEKECLDDHYVGADIPRMEEIARSVPLSAIRRPAWDEEVLSGLGAQRVETDPGIWEKVWSSEEKLNYRSTPMFMVRAVK